MSKFFDTKDMIQDLNDMMVEIREMGINVTIQPNNDIQAKMLSIGRTDMLMIRFNNLENQMELYDILYDRLCVINDYMELSGFKMKLYIKKHKSYSRRDSSDQETGRYGYDVTLKELKTTIINQFLTNGSPKSDASKRASALSYINLSFEPMNKTNESLPNQKTVDQLKMVAKLSKKTDIGNRIPDENGSNMRYMRNPIDNLESREDYDRKNKDYIPSWNLKHLLSPFKGKDKHKVKIKRLKESQSEMIEFDDNEYEIVYGEDIIADTDFGVYRNYDNNMLYLVSKNEIDSLDSDNFRFEGLAVTRKYYLLASNAKDKYDEVKADADSIRYSDEQYEDPSEWYASDEYHKYYDDGRWNKIFWDYTL